MVDSSTDQAPGVNDDQELEQWKVAARTAPSREQIAELQRIVEDHEKILNEKRDELATALVRRALTFGFKATAADFDTTPKQLHIWRSRLDIQDEDLSEVPVREMRREKARMARIERELGNEEKLRAELQAAQERIAMLNEVVK